MSSDLEFVRLGIDETPPRLIDYQWAWDEQRRIHAEVADGRRPGTVLLLEHSDVYTAGRRTEPAERPQDGTPVVDVDRGGKITWHGPGQLVGYPIFDLGAHRKDLHWFLRRIEDALILALARFGIAGERREGYTGVWTGDGDRKIASIGIHVRQWVSWHGFALNVTTDLAPFDLIVPCGIPDVVMTSVARELERAGAPAIGAAALGHGVRDAVVDAFVHTFGFSGIESLDAVATVAGR